MRRIITTAVLATALTGITTATADAGIRPAERPTFKETRAMVRTILNNYAEGTEGELTVGGCRNYEKRWVVCRARIDWKHTTARFRFKMTSDYRDNYIVATTETRQLR